MSVKGIEDVIVQLRASAAAAAGKPAAGGARVAAEPGEAFVQALRAALEQVNSSQMKADGLARDFELGKPGVALHEVMVSMQKANIAFQGTVQVRNRLVAAYQDIMNMQI